MSLTKKIEKTAESRFIFEIFFFFAADITTFEIGSTYTVAFTSSSKWNSIQFTPETARVESNFSDGKFRNTISFDSPGAHGRYAQLIGKRLVVAYRQNEKLFLIGTPHYPCVFQPSNEAGYTSEKNTFSFAADQPTPPLLLPPEYQISEAVVGKSLVVS